MTPGHLKKAVHTWLIIAISAFLFASSFGVVLSGMSMASDEHMHTCPFMGMAAICTMSPFEHVQAVKSQLLAIPAASQALILLLTLLAVAFFQVRSGLPRAPLRHFRALSYREYVTNVFNAFKEAFSNGIIHRKEPDGIAFC